MPGYDIIGDIHGHADALEALLHRLGYRNRNGAWRQVGREVVFLGDFIDRGPRQIDAVTIARRMVDAGSAHAISGNHESNAVGFASRGPDGKWLRIRGSNNTHQHKAFLEAVGCDSPLHRELVDWFKTLPLWLEIPGVLRAVHACWDGSAMAALAPHLDECNRMLADDIPLLFTKGEPAYEAAERVLKGLEVPLPEGFVYHDKDGVPRRNTRIRWWDDGALTYRHAAIVDEDLAAQLPDVAFPGAPFPIVAGTPLFFGHYWMGGVPRLVSSGMACLDFSVAKDGFLAAYSHDGELNLRPDKLTWVAPGNDAEPSLPAPGS